MKILGNIIIGLSGIAIIGVLSLFIAEFMADHGMLGTCFEGSCGYAAFFAAFPVMWLLLTVTFLIGWRVWVVRRKA